MFVKYLGQFEKAEAEWVQEVLDLHDGEYANAVQSIKDALERLTGRSPMIAEQKQFDDTIAGCFFASRDWWLIGIDRLVALGRIERPPVPA